MKDKSLLPLSLALLMFPQLAQTLCSPALADFAARFSVSPRMASQVLTVYFLAFALGVVTWGRMSDRIGRRRALLSGMTVYALGSACALIVPSFGGLLAAQTVAAFGAAAGSVVTQTIFRDRFTGSELARVFSVATMVLALSPALGLFAGATLVGAFGYRGVFWCLLMTALGLLGWAAKSLPETRPAHVHVMPVLQTLRLLAKEPQVWRSALLVAIFNVAIFSYYALGPFLFTRLGLSETVYGVSGLLMALGSALGALLNRRFIRAGCHPQRLLTLAVMLALGGGIGVQQLQHTMWFVIPMIFVLIAFGLAIPNVLGQALVAFGDRIGTASALFGLLYYLMIGLGMLLAGWSQALGGSLVVCAYLAAWIALLWRPRGRTELAQA